MAHECIIGIMYDYGYTTLATLKDVIEESQGLCSHYTLNQYLDKRYNTNLKRFDYCPNCGKKIDWEEIRKQNGL